MQRIFAPGLFANKVAMVTGGGTGIGFGTAAGLAQLGAKVVIASRSIDKIDAAVEQLQPYCVDGAEVMGVECNIRNRDEVAEAIEKTLEKWGRLDGLVNNGGGQFYAEAENISEKGFHAVVDTNLNGTWNCIQEAYHQYMSEHGGNIVNIVLISSMGAAGISHSAAAREAVKNLSMSLGAEWAQKDIQVNCIAPGMIYSDTATASYGPLGERVFKESEKATPAGRMGAIFESGTNQLADDLIPQIIWHLGPGVKYTTGQTVDVCGGLSLFNNYLKGQGDITEFIENMHKD